MTDRDNTLRQGPPWLARAAMVAIAVVIAGQALAACGQRAGQAQSGGTSGAADPRLVAVAGSSAHGSSSRIELISPRTGLVAKVVAHVSTGNGFALSPDSADLYVAGPAGSAIEIRRVSVATGTASFVADGAYPAVSPDGRYLAYATGSRFSQVAVRDLRTGLTRVIGLRALLGNGGTFLNQGQITWLGDGDEVVAVPGTVASEAAAGISASTGAGTAARGQVPSGRQSLIVIRIRPGGLTARQLVVSDPYQEMSLVISGDLSQPRAVLIARTGFAGAGTIARVSLRGRGYRARVIGRLPRGAIPVVIAPYGDCILYLAGHTPPELWDAIIRDGQLTGRHRLLTDTSRFGVDQAAW